MAAADFDVSQHPSFPWVDGFRSELGRELRRAHRAAGVFSVIIAEVDDADRLSTLDEARFSRVPELVEGLLRSQIRRTDQVYALLRRGCVILAPETARRDAFAMIQRLSMALPGQLDARLPDRPVSVTFGAAEHPTDGRGSEQLVQTALSNIEQARQARTSSLYTWDVERVELPGILDVLLTTLASRDRYLIRHARLTARVMVELARTSGYSPPDQELFYLAGLLHDIGKLIIPDRILRTADRLTPAEMTIVQQHIPVGKRILEEAPGVRRTTELVPYHHERYDGNGYPYGPSGSEIPTGGRVLAVADAYAAVRVDTPYRPARSREAALTEIERGSGTRYDPQIVRALRAALQRVDPT